MIAYLEPGQLARQLGDRAAVDRQALYVVRCILLTDVMEWGMERGRFRRVIQPCSLAGKGDTTQHLLCSFKDKVSTVMTTKRIGAPPTLAVIFGF